MFLEVSTSLLSPTNKICPESIQPCTMKKRHLLKIQEKLYLGQWYLSLLQSRHLRTSCSPSNCHQMLCHIFLNLINGLKSLPFQRFSEKPEVAGCQIWAVGGFSHLADLMFHQKSLYEMWYMSRACCLDVAANHQLSIAAAYWIIWIDSPEECSKWNLMQILCSSCSVILSVTATYYTCSLNGFYCPHWLVQWSLHCSYMCVPTHSLWLPGYIDVMWTILVTLTMAGLFLVRLCT